MKAIDPAGDIIDIDQVWWWQLPDSACPAEVRQACYRNALSEVAFTSTEREVRGAITEVLAAFAWVIQREGRRAPRKRGELRVQVLIDWALIHRDPDVQVACDRLWRVVLSHHRADWEAEAQKLIGRWNDPASPLHDLRRRLRGEAEDE